MIYLSGVTNNRDEPRLIEAGIGLMLNAGNSYHLRVSRYPWWAADIVGINNRGDLGDRFDWLDRLPRDRCLFAVSPDEYPSAERSLARGLEHAPLIRDMGFPVAVVAQDGAENLTWPWDELNCLFIGGERNLTHPWREWKVSPAAASLAEQARNAGKWVHMGRVNSVARMLRAKEMGCNSCDGTFIKYRRRVKATDYEGARDERGAAEIGHWLVRLDLDNPLFPPTFELPALPIHREAISA